MGLGLSISKYMQEYQHYLVPHLATRLQWRQVFIKLYHGQTMTVPLHWRQVKITLYHGHTMTWRLQWRQVSIDLYQGQTMTVPLHWRQVMIELYHGQNLFDSTFNVGLCIFENIKPWIVISWILLENNMYA